MRMVITGAAGFIGSRFTEMFLESPLSAPFDEILLLDALTYSGHVENLTAVFADQRITFVHGSITDGNVVDRAMTGATAVVHLAAESHVDRSINDAHAFYATNVMGTQILLDAARRHRVTRFIHVSTDEVYGSTDGAAWDEQHVLEPSSPYSASKAASDLAALAYFKTFDLPVIVTRCTNNYGPRQTPEKLIPLFLTRFFDGRSAPLYGDGLNVREWIHVDDHCRALLAVFERGVAGEIYNIGGGTPRTNMELVRRLATLVGRDESFIEPVADRLGHDRRYALNDEKIRRELGVSPVVDFEAGLEQVVAWYRENESWWRPLVSEDA